MANRRPTNTELSGGNSESVSRFNGGNPSVRIADGLTGRTPCSVDPRRILRNMLAAEERYLPSASCLKYQSEVKPYMRRLLTAWMLEVCEEEQMTETVFPLAVNYLDRLLSTTVSIRKSRLQLTGAVCLLIASKFSQRMPMTVYQLAAYTDHSVTVDDLLTWESLILQILHWDVAALTPNDFLRHLLNDAPSCTDKLTDIQKHAQTFIEMCLTEETFIGYPPSLIAAACISVASGGIFGNNSAEQDKVFRELLHLTSIDLDCLRTCQEQVEEHLQAIIQSPNNQSSNPFHPAENGTEDIGQSKCPVTPVDIHSVICN